MPVWLLNQSSMSPDTAGWAPLNLMAEGQYASTSAIQQPVFRFLLAGMHLGSRTCNIVFDKQRCVVEEEQRISGTGVYTRHICVLSDYFHEVNEVECAHRARY